MRRIERAHIARQAAGQGIPRYQVANAEAKARQDVLREAYLKTHPNATEKDLVGKRIVAPKTAFVRRHSLSSRKR